MYKMLDDVLYKILRKSLRPSLYHAISRSAFGRDRAWKRIDTYAETFRYYASRGLRFQGRAVAEVGCGDQLFSALFFLAAGATRVVLIEPKLDPSLGRLAGDLSAFNAFPGRPRDLVPTEVVGRIIAYRDLDQAPSALDGKVDVACSHLVLEHFENLESFFAHTRRLLAPGGVSHNRVDLSDHTYHVLGKYPFLQRFAASRILHHLRYSDAVFRFVNDPKCYMNRVLLPEYLRLAVAHGFRVENLERVFHDRAVVHPDLHRRYAGSDPRDLQVVNFSLDLVKPA